MEGEGIGRHTDLDTGVIPLDQSLCLRLVPSRPVSILGRRHSRSRRAGCLCHRPCNHYIRIS